MKKNFLIVLAAFIGLSAFGQFHDAKEPFMTKSFKEAFSSTEASLRSAQWRRSKRQQLQTR